MPQIVESDFDAPDLQDTIDRFVLDLLNVHPHAEVRALAVEIAEEHSGAVVVGVIGELAEHLRRALDFRNSITNLLARSDAEWDESSTGKRTVSLATQPE